MIKTVKIQGNDNMLNETDLGDIAINLMVLSTLVSVILTILN